MRPWNDISVQFNALVGWLATIIFKSWTGRSGSRRFSYVSDQLLRKKQLDAPLVRFYANNNAKVIARNLVARADPGFIGWWGGGGSGS